MITTLIILYIISTFLAFLGIIFYGARPSRSLSWLFTIVFLPFVGVILYMFFGMNRRKIKFFELKKNHKRKLYDTKHKIENNHEPFDNFVSNKKDKLSNLITKNNNLMPYNGNKVEVLDDGKQTFKSIFDAIRDAKSFIHIHYYIFDEGELLDELYNILKLKVEEGVEVRVMYDYIGSFDWKRKLLKRFRAVGISIFASMPIGFGSLRFSLNYRNHRKIVIVDGKVGFTGGFNVTDNYITPLSDLGIWKDTHVRIEGPAVESLHKVFIKDYYFTSNEDLLADDKYLPKLESKGESVVQIVASGPDSDYAAIMQQYIMLINLAERNICITNPYFIPSASVLTALKIAALSGVEIKILLPEASDSVTARYSMRSYFEEILEVGIEIYLNTDTFLHSKLVLIDEEILSIGSGNFDYRSFDHNFETNVLIYDDKVTKSEYEKFQQDCLASEKINFEEFKERPLKNKFFEGLSRFFSPLL